MTSSSSGAAYETVNGMEARKSGTDLSVVLGRSQVQQIKTVVNQYVNESINAFDKIEDDETDDTGTCIVNEFWIPLNLYDTLREKLPYHHSRFKIIIDFEDGFMNIRTVPGVCHEAACGAWDIDINAWAMNYTPLPYGTDPPLKPTRSGGMYCVVRILTC
jgi:hypothetical protein